MARYPDYNSYYKKKITAKGMHTTFALRALEALLYGFTHEEYLNSLVDDEVEVIRGCPLISGDTRVHLQGDWERSTSSSYPMPKLSE
jgi:hypothetical protein